MPDNQRTFKHLIPVLRSLRLSLSLAGAAYMKFDGIDRFLGPISGEGVFKPSSTAALGPISGEGVFKPSANPRGSVIVGDNHFRRIDNF